MRKREERVLKYVKRHPDVTKKKLYKKYPFLKDDFHYVKPYLYAYNTVPIKNGEYESGEEKIVETSTFRLSRQGIIFFEDKCNKFWSFALPYGITTAIAIASLVAQFLKC